MLLFLESDIILKVSKVEFIEKVVIVNKIRKNIVIAFFHFESTYMFHRMWLNFVVPKVFWKLVWNIGV